MKIMLSLFFSFWIVLAGSYPSLLYHGNCTACHYKTKAVSAPSIKEVREHYIRAFPKKEDFVTYMSSWVYTPTLEGSIMQHSVEKYKLMPTLAYDKKTLEIIAAYIYDMKFDNMK